MTLADKIREFVVKNSIDPARKSGKPTVTIKASDIHKAMGLQNNFPSVCQALDADKFLDFASVMLSKRTGPPKSSSVVWTYDLMSDKKFHFQVHKAQTEANEDFDKTKVRANKTDIGAFLAMDALQVNKSQSDSLQQLLSLGFEEVGHWLLEEGHVTFLLNKSSKESNILYSFVVNGDVKYIGKSVQTLQKRMYLYKQGSGTQITNIRNKEDIRACLEREQEVKIYVLVPDIQMNYKGMPINIAAGLEDNLIVLLKPEWNKR
jgi:hypothetical protein